MTRLPRIACAAIAPGLVLACFSGCTGGESDGSPAERPAAAVAAPASVERGQYLATVGVCGDCHTPWAMGPDGPGPDESRYLSGHPEGAPLEAAPMPDDWMMAMSASGTAFAGPWGISYAVNLTPHDTGLGVWSEEMFVTAMRTGKHMGAGRPILPPMPWPSYGAMTDDDLRSLWMYLQSIPPIDNVAPAAAIAAAPAN
jgi:mono/diheme cytochrome c family protein